MIFIVVAIIMFSRCSNQVPSNWVLSSCVCISSMCCVLPSTNLQILTSHVILTHILKRAMFIYMIYMTEAFAEGRKGAFCVQRHSLVIQLMEYSCRSITKLCASIMTACTHSSSTLFLVWTLNTMYISW